MDRITIPRRQFLAATAAAAGTSLVGLPAWAKAAYPSKPVRFIVPFNPGGATDIVARVLAEAVSKKLGQPVIVENKAGASAMLGTDMVAKSAPDGYNVVVSLSTSLLINQFLYTKMAYNPQKDLLMLSLLASAPVTLVVHPSVPANNMKELLALSKKQDLNFAVTATGSAPHLAGVELARATGALQGRRAPPSKTPWPAKPRC